jgi:hypothetical protein
MIFRAFCANCLGQPNIQKWTKPFSDDEARRFYNINNKAANKMLFYYSILIGKSLNTPELLTLEHIKLLTHVQNHPQNQLRG